MNRRFLLLIGMILVVLAVLVAGCVPGDQDTASANKLNVHMTIMDPELSPPAGPRDVARVNVTLFTDQGAYQTSVSSNQLTHGETFTCNGVSFSRDGSLEFTFDYTSSSTVSVLYS
jgi:hypothetical protein